MAVKYLDPIGGNDANDGTTFANRWKTITLGATAARIAPGDTIRIMKSNDSTSLGMTATWTNKSATVTLNSALNVLVTDCESAWTASANVTATADGTTYRTGTKACKLVVASGFLTGKIAYFDLGSNKDYSAYQGVTFWIRHSIAIDGNITLRFCSDTIGDTVVDTFNIPAESFLTGAYYPLYIDKGSALGSAIRSISLAASVDPGTVDIYIDNISTVKAVGADNLNLTSLISPANYASNEGWWAIRELNGTTVKLDQYPGLAGGTASRGYSGSTQTVTTYKQDTTKYPIASATALSITDSGTAGSEIFFSGGWNQTDMSTQTGVTWMDGRTGTCSGFYCFLVSFHKFEKLYMCRWQDAWHRLSGGGASSIWLGDLYGAANSNSHFNADLLSSCTICSSGTLYFTAGYDGIYFDRVRVCTFGHLYAWSQVNCGMDGGLTSSDGYMTKFGNCFIYYSGATGLFTATNFFGLKFGNVTITDCVQGVDHSPGSQGKLSNIQFGDVTISGCTHASKPGYQMDGLRGVGIRMKSLTVTGSTYSGINDMPGPNSYLGDVTTSGNAVGWRHTSVGGNAGRVKVKSCSIAEATKQDFSSFNNNYYIGTEPWSLKDYLTAGDNRVDIGPGLATITSENGSNRHTASGLGWKFAVTDATYISEMCPARIRLARVMCKSSGLVTVSLWVYRDSTSITAKLLARANQIAGLTSDQSASAASSSAWEQLSVTFTPTAYGLVDIELLAYGGTTHYFYFDDMRITQA